jgi:hypothetical protein
LSNFQKSEKRKKITKRNKRPMTECYLAQKLSLDRPINSKTARSALRKLRLKLAQNCKEVQPNC